MNNFKLYFFAFFRYLFYVLEHKYYVFCEAKKLGIPIRGLLHDMSKFNPKEFLASMKYFKIDTKNENYKNEFKYAWNHHQKHNPHHSEYWCQISGDKVKPLKIPRKYLLEMVADINAMGRKFGNNSVEYYHNHKHEFVFHPETKDEFELLINYEEYLMTLIIAEVKGCINKNDVGALLISYKPEDVCKITDAFVKQYSGTMELGLNFMNTRIRTLFNIIIEKKEDKLTFDYRELEKLFETLIYFKFDPYLYISEVYKELPGSFDLLKLICEYEYYTSYKLLIKNINYINILSVNVDKLLQKCRNNSRIREDITLILESSYSKRTKG